MAEDIPGIEGYVWADDRPIVGDDQEYDLFRRGIDSFIATKPATAVAHVRAMCREFSELTKVYSHAELDQGLWAIFGAGISCEQYVFDPSVDLGLRVDCIDSMYVPFRDVVAHSAIGKSESVQIRLLGSDGRRKTNTGALFMDWGTCIILWAEKLFKPILTFIAVNSPMKTCDGSKHAVTA